MKRARPFILAATDHGPLILNNLDFAEWGNGVGAQLLEYGCYEPDEMHLLTQFLDRRRQSHGDGIVAIDAGANIGVVSVTLGKHMTGWGKVIAIEPQERIFYALCGNIALANLFNVRAMWCALTGDIAPVIAMMEPDYTKPASFGSFEIRGKNADLGQTDLKPGPAVPARRLDSICGDRCDFVKLDIEGMELEVLSAADRTLRQLRPLIWFETLKGDQRAMHELLESRRYAVKAHGNMSLAVPIP